MRMKPKYSKQFREACREKQEIDSNGLDSRKNNTTQSQGASLNRRSEQASSVGRRQCSSYPEQKSARNDKTDTEDEGFGDINRHKSNQIQRTPQTHRESIASPRRLSPKLAEDRLVNNYDRKPHRKKYEAIDQYPKQQQVLKNPKSPLRNVVTYEGVREKFQQKNTDESFKERARETTKSKRQSKMDNHQRAFDRSRANSVHGKHTEIQNPRSNKKGGNVDKHFASDLKSRDRSEDGKPRRNNLQTGEKYGFERRMSLGGDDNLLMSSKEVRVIKISNSSSTTFPDQRVTDIFRTLVFVKGENLSLTDVTDIMRNNLRIQIEYNDPDDFLSMFEQHEERFSIEFVADEPLISPKTDVAICPVFTNDTCKLHECIDLHICKYFLLDKCPRKKCKFGHNLSTKHNTEVLQKHDIGGLRKDCVMTLIRNIGSRNVSTLPLLCKFYNNEGKCRKGGKCMHLHICKNFINDDCKFGKICKRCHNILAKQPKSVFEKYGMIPDSSNYKKIISLIRGTLHDGGVLLKREIQPISNTRLTGQQTKTSQETLEYASSEITSSDESDASALDDSFNNTEEEFAEQESDENEYSSDSSLSTIDKDMNQADDTILGNQSDSTHASNIQFPDDNGCDTRQGNCRPGSRQGYQTPRQDEIKSLMTFESQTENKIFRIRMLNGQWQIADLSGTWMDMEEGSEELMKFHDDFIKFAESILSKAQV